MFVTVKSSCTIVGSHCKLPNYNLKGSTRSTRDREASKRIVTEKAKKFRMIASRDVNSRKVYDF